MESEFALYELNRKSQWNCMTLPYETEYIERHSSHSTSSTRTASIAAAKTTTTTAAQAAVIAVEAVAIADPIERCTRNFQLISNSRWVNVCVLMRFGAASDRFSSVDNDLYHREHFFLLILRKQSGRSLYYQVGSQTRALVRLYL